jgi:hypothetical protein
MNVVENNVWDDVERNLFLLENDEDHDTYTLIHDVERFEMVVLMLVDLLN